MRTIFKSKFSLTCLVIFIMLFSNDVMAQKSKFRMRFRFDTYKNNDSRTLVVKFYGQQKKDLVPVNGAEINFYNILDEDEVFLGMDTTDQEGFATIMVNDDQPILKDEEGYMNFVARFEGSDGLKAKENDVAVIDLNLSMEFEEIDSVKSLLLFANVIGADGVELPLEEGEVLFYVQGMLARLPIEEGWIEDGEYVFEFPTDLPGNVDGELTVYANIEDSDDFGNIEVMKTVNWGTGIDVPVRKRNELFSSAAPIWMIVVLTVLLIGVWTNYVYTIVNLVQMKKESELSQQGENLN